MAQSKAFKAGLLASGQFLANLGVLVSAAVLSRIFTKGDYATYRQARLALAFVSPLLLLGLPKALYYFLPGEKKRVRGVLVDNVLLLAIMGAGFSLFLLFGGNHLLARQFSNPRLVWLLLIFAPYPLLTMPRQGFSACLMVRGRTKWLVGFNVSARLCTVTVLVVAALIWRTPEAVIIGLVGIGAVEAALALRMMFASCRDGIGRPSPSGMWSQMKFAVPLGIATVVTSLAIQLDKMIVASMCPPEQFAVYVNGAIRIPLINIVTGAINVVILPDIVRYLKEGKHAEALRMIRRAAAKAAMILLPAMCFLFVMAPEVITLLFSAKYAGSVLPFRLYLLMVPLQMIYLNSILMAAGKNHLIVLVAAVGLGVNLILSIILVSLMGYLGAVVATLLMMYFWYMPASLRYSGKALRVSAWRVLPWMAILRIFGLSVAACGVVIPAFFFPIGGNIARLLVFLPAYVGILMVLYSRFGLVDLRKLLALVGSKLRR